MSKQVHCPECQSKNTPGSKFCNHCGARLPKSTNILCPRCQTPNPHSNFYCDNCGSRLKNETNQASTTEESTSKTSDLPTSAKMFSLPTREPGDTGELDTDSLPDWIKSQGEDSAEHEPGKLPRLSDLTPEERGKKDDLPGWLIDTDSDNILKESPEDITTEHFLNLIQDINEEEREKLSGVLNDLSAVDERANLPDWLQGAAQSGENDTIASEPTPPPMETEGAADDEAALLAADEPDWLLDLEGAPPESAEKTEEALPTFAEIAPQDPDELPDWLAELEPSLGQAQEMEPDSSPAAQPDEGALAGWLADEIASPEDFGFGSEPDPVSEEDIPDWLSGETAEEPSHEGVVEELSLDAAAETSLTGWLAEFDMEEAAPETAVSDSDIAAQAPEEPKRSLTDWLNDFDKEKLPDTPPDTTDDIDSVAEASPDWLASDGAAEETGSAATPAAAAADDLDRAPAEPTSAEPEADWLSSDIDSDISLSSGDIDTLPDWLDELDADEQPKPETSELDDTLTDLFGEQPEDAVGELRWLEDAEAEDALAKEADRADLTGTLEEETLVDAAASQQDDAELDETPDWLAELATFNSDNLADAEEEVLEAAHLPEQPEEVVAETTAEPEFDIDDVIGAPEPATLDTFEFDEVLLSEEPESAGDWVDINGILSGQTENEALPDWLEQLDDVVDTESIIAASDEAAPSEIPEWIANLRPDEDEQFASVLPTALVSESDTERLTSEPVELSDADLPEWLDASLSQKTAAETKEAFDWFADGDYEDAPDELEALLADLPPAPAPEDMLQKAEIPDWLKELKPRELTGEVAPMLESHLESSGPLAGMSNTIAIEPIIAMPRATSTSAGYSVSPEQAQQSRLLRQLTQEEPKPPTAEKSAFGERRVFGLRILVAILLFAAIGLGLYGPANLKSSIPVEMPVPATDFHRALEDAAGQSVLVAFEYTPALAGELNHEASMLLAELDANGSQILTSSQYAAGTAVAKAMTADYDVAELGFIPGEAMGLRQLSNCLGRNGADITCAALQGLSLNAALSDDLSDVALIVVLTGKRSNLVNWVEQVRTNTDIPIVVGTTQALAPVAAPYYASTQVEGYLSGLPDTMAYQQTYLSGMDNAPANAQYGAHTFVLLVTAVILLLGGLIMGLRKRGS